MVYNLETVEFDHSNHHYRMLEGFFAEAKKFNYKNNSSFDNIKLKRLTPPDGNLWISIYQNKIVSTNGLEHLSSYKKDHWRLLTRGCSLPIVRTLMPMNNLSKNFITISFSIFYMIKIQLEWLQTNTPHFTPIVTANAPRETDDAGKSFKVYRTIFPALTKKKVLSLIDKDVKIHGCYQDVYKINIDNYINERNKSISRG